MKYKNLVKRIGCKILFVLLAFMLGWLFGMAINFFHGKDQMTETLSTAAEEGKKQIAITFDDGPNPEYTMKLLEGLKKRGVKATFFVLGEEVERHPDILKAAYDDGHLIDRRSHRSECEFKRCAGRKLCRNLFPLHYSTGGNSAVCGG